MGEIFAAALHERGTAMVVGTTAAGNVGLEPGPPTARRVQLANFPHSGPRPRTVRGASRRGVTAAEQAEVRSTHSALRRGRTDGQPPVRPDLRPTSTRAERAVGPGRGLVGIPPTRSTGLSGANLRFAGVNVMQFPVDQSVF